MRKLHKAAVAAAILGSVTLIGTGTATAQPSNLMHEGGGCKSHDLNIALLDQIGIANGLLGNALNGEGSAGGQYGHVGSEMGCEGGHGGY